MRTAAGLVWFEAAAMLAFSGTLAYLHPMFFVKFVLPVWFLGQAAALAENYLEHHYAIPGNRGTDSVSCYNRLYNWLWFNNGYHQEHHCKPTVHWTQVPELRKEMLPETERRWCAGRIGSTCGGRGVRRFSVPSPYRGLLRGFRKRIVRSAGFDFRRVFGRKNGSRRRTARGERENVENYRGREGESRVGLRVILGVSRAQNPRFEKSKRGKFSAIFSRGGETRFFGGARRGRDGIYFVVRRNRCRGGGTTER